MAWEPMLRGTDSVWESHFRPVSLRHVDAFCLRGQKTAREVGGVPERTVWGATSSKALLL